MALPRVLTVMGSGETAPTMTTVHQSLLGRLGPDAVAVLLGTASTSSPRSRSTPW